MFFEFEEGEEGIASDPVDDLEAFYITIPLWELYEPFYNAFHIHFLHQKTQLETLITFVLKYPSLLNIPNQLKPAIISQFIPHDSLLHMPKKLPLLTAHIILLIIIILKPTFILILLLKLQLSGHLAPIQL